MLKVGFFNEMIIFGGSEFMGLMAKTEIKIYKFVAQKLYVNRGHAKVFYYSQRPKYSAEVKARCQIDIK